MISLIYKDMLLQKKMFLFGLGYSLFVLVAFQNPVFAAGSYIMGAVAIAYMLILGACAYEDKNKSEVILLSLPLKRRNIVISKYLSVFFFTIASLALIGILGALMKGCGLPVPRRYLGVTDILGTIVSLAILVTLYFPLYFRFGYIKSRIVNMVLFLLVFFAPSLIREFGQNNSGPAPLKQVLSALNSIPGEVALLAAAGFALLLMLASLALSITLYKNREF